MKTLHKEDFVEFAVLPYIIGFFALCALAVAVVAKKKGLYALFISFILFGILNASLLFGSSSLHVVFP